MIVYSCARRPPPVIRQFGRVKALGWWRKGMRMSAQRRRRVLQSTESTHGTTLPGTRKTDCTGGRLGLGADAGQADAVFLFDHRAWRPTAWANTGRGMIPGIAQ